MPFYNGMLSKSPSSLSLWGDKEPKRWEEQFSSLGPESLLKRNSPNAWNSPAVRSRIRPANSYFHVTCDLNVDNTKSK
jgi:hypothetical protein